MKGRPKGLPKTGGRIKGVRSDISIKNEIKNKRMDKMLSFFDSFKDNDKFYVYGHFNSVNNECFYIGKGCGGRAWKIDGRNELWDKYVELNGNYEARLLICDISEEEAFMIERVLIEQRRPITNIRNISNQLKFNI